MSAYLPPPWPRLDLFFSIDGRFNVIIYFIIDPHAAFAAPDEDENQDSTCHGMSLHELKNGHNTLCPYILISLVVA